MSIDLKFVELTADILEIFFIMYILVYTCVCFLTKQNDPSHYGKTHPQNIL